MKLLLAICLALAATTAARAEELRAALPGHGAVVMTIPVEWAAKADAVGGTGSAMVNLQPKNGAAFRIVLTPIARGPHEAKPGVDALRSQVGKLYAMMPRDTIAEDLRVNTMKGKKTYGAYYTVTLKSALPGAYKSITQGLFEFEDIDLALYLATNDPPAPLIAETLRVLDTMRRQKRG